MGHLACFEDFFVFATVVRSGFVCFGLVAETHFKRLVWFFPEPVQDQFQSHSLLRLKWSFFSTLMIELRNLLQSHSPRLKRHLCLCHHFTFDRRFQQEQQRKLGFLFCTQPRLPIWVLKFSLFVFTQPTELQDREAESQADPYLSKKSLKYQ